jgi:hypothetical protein
MAVEGGEIGTVCRMFQHHETQFHKSLKSVDGSYVGARCHPTTEYLTTMGLGVWFELQAFFYQSICGFIPV